MSKHLEKGEKNHPKHRGGFLRVHKNASKLCTLPMGWAGSQLVELLSAMNKTQALHPNTRTKPGMLI